MGKQWPVVRRLSKCAGHDGCSFPHTQLPGVLLLLWDSALLQCLGAHPGCGNTVKPLQPLSFDILYGRVPPNYILGPKTAATPSILSFLPAEVAVATALVVLCIAMVQVELPVALAVARKPETGTGVV